MFRFDCTFSNFNCTKRVQLHTILRPGLAYSLIRHRHAKFRLDWQTLVGLIGVDFEYYRSSVTIAIIFAFYTILHSRMNPKSTFSDTVPSVGWTQCATITWYVIVFVLVRHFSVHKNLLYVICKLDWRRNNITPLAEEDYLWNVNIGHCRSTIEETRAVKVRAHSPTMVCIVMLEFSAAFRHWTTAWCDSLI